MSARDRDTKSLQDKLKSYFKQRAGGGNFPPRFNFALTPDLEREISLDTPPHRRLKAIRDLSEKLLTKRLENRDLERIWVCLLDLLQPEQPRDYRHAAFYCLNCLIRGQYEQLYIMRGLLFRFIKEHNIPEDALPRFEMLQSLTEKGKDIKCFEEEIGRFILDWMSMPEGTTLVKKFLEFIVNLVKFNAAYLDDDIVADIVNNTCFLCCYSGVTEVVLLCLQALEAVVSYSIFPRQVLRTFVAALCRTVNVEYYCQISWKIMRNMLGTDLGHAALCETVDLLTTGAPDAGLTRGAVFYINMALWGSKRVSTLKATHTSVLPAFLKALDGEQPVVTYEVILALQTLVARNGADMFETAWDTVFSILRKIIGQVEVQAPNPLIESHFHELVTAIEHLYEQKRYNGNVSSLFAFIDHCAHLRPESSILNLISWRASLILPGRQDWLQQLSLLLERYCRQEKRVGVRTNVLYTVHKIVQMYRHEYEEELLERVILPHVQHIALDADPNIRCTVAQLLVELAYNCQSKTCTDLLDIAEKVLNRPFELYVTNEAISLPPDTNVTDIKTVLDGLILIFHHKMLRLPSTHPVRVYLILVGHLERHYSRPSLFQHHPSFRMKILELFLSARANSSCHVGFCYDSNDVPLSGSDSLRLKPVFSPYVCVEGGSSQAADGTTRFIPSPNATGHTQTTSYVSIRKACKLIIVCLKQEKDWVVLQMVLKEIPHVMQSKPLILGKNNNEIELLASALCSMVADASLCLPESLRLPPNTKLGRSEFHGQVLPVLACLAPYHTHLDSQAQQMIVKCLMQFGLILRKPDIIMTLMMYTLETQDTMVKLFPQILLDLTKISDTTQIAVAMLEFLSTLTRLPKVYASFVADQYMSVFAILLPYTNPSRYNHYVVSLAHHVIAAWFLKCRLSYRRHFVSFIIHSLRNFTIMPFEEGKVLKKDFPLNEDSSNRMRSSSLGSKGREPVKRNSQGAGEVGRPSPAASSAAFHHELTETCVDLMARYTFSPCTTKPQRGPIAEFMFTGGQSVTWVVGHKLVTVTTSGCLQNALKMGLCDRCTVLCKQHTDSLSSPSLLGTNSDTLDSSGAQNSGEIKRYTKYTLQHSRSIETTGSSLSMSDNSLQPPSIGSGQTTRQNSSENKSQSSDSGLPTSSETSDTQAQLSLKLENLAIQEEKGGWSRVERQVESGGCVCWCSRWAEIHVRRPTGDVSWSMRMQNQMNFDSKMESPLKDIMGLLAPSVQNLNTPSSRSSCVEDSRNDILIDMDLRSRSDSSSSQHKSTQYSPGTAGGNSVAGGALQSMPPPPDLQKSSSDSVVLPGGNTVEKKPPHASSHCIVPPSLQHSGLHMVTEPINIPGSPQRQSSSSTTTDDDDNIPPTYDQHGKSRQPVRRSNSSPEMSSSWKLTFQQRERADDDLRETEAAPEEEELQPPHEMITLAATEPTTMPVSHHHQKKQGKNKDMRVSCEAIPEEMSSGGTPPSVPAPHPHLMTYNSDPGQQPAPRKSLAAVSVDALVGKSGLSGSQKASTESLRSLDYKVSAKPPQSPTPASPGRGPRGSVQIQMSKAASKQDRDDLPPLSRSKRSNTISVMSPIRRRRDNSSPKAREGPRLGGGGVTPSFLLLQLFHNMDVRSNPLGMVNGQASGSVQNSSDDWMQRPLMVSGVQHERSVKNLDHIPPLETYRVGVLYVGPGQESNETQILRNEFGSVRYSEFLRDLGTLIALEDADTHGLYLNVERGGKDGHFTYVWQDDIMQVQFHVATLMPNIPSDPTANEKRKHIGNDYVSIVYNDSGADFNIHTIKGQFNFCIVIVEPLEHGINRVTIKSKDERIERTFIQQTKCKVISDRNAALLVRQLALHCNLASLISRSLNESEHIPYASNTLERLRIIKRLRTRLIQDRIANQETNYTKVLTDQHRKLNVDDFTEYT